MPVSLASQSIIQYFFHFAYFSYLLSFFSLPLFRICADDTKYYKQGTNEVLLCDIAALNRLFFK